MAKQKLNVHPHLTLTVLACLGLAGALTYFLCIVPQRLSASDPDWLQRGASWATAFVGQLAVFLAFICTVAAHALSGRWSWSVRLFAAISAYAGLSMAMLAANAYEDAERLTGHVRNPTDFLEGAFILAAGILLYLLFALMTFVWIATRGRRFGATPSRPRSVAAD